MQFLVFGGVGYAGLGVHEMGAAEATRRSGFDIFYGADLKIGLDHGFALDTRLWNVSLGTLEGELRFSGQLLRRWKSGLALGLEAATQRSDTDIINTLGVVLTTQAPKAYGSPY